ncbi:aminotransferase class I/II-fold pyridoxal phosphate-dependent enzyme [bacterium]|nr:aminotransferase class I/II-fold pyridoxal phosphate-dependent enzyme [bacterium]
MSIVNLFNKKHNIELFTTPSHAQRFFITSKFQQFYKYDISETDTHNPQEALEKAEKKASSLYKTKQTCFLINGSTCGVIASVLSCVKPDDSVLIWENAHQCHKNAVELAGAKPVFYELEKDENWGIYKSLDIDYIEKIINQTKPKAIIVTSPSYEGIVSDIVKLKEICERNNLYLIVDEAHGALYPFSERLPQSAVKIADFTIQSLHKTAGGLNPTALVHTNTVIDLHNALNKICTTSPSYPLLMSIERNISYLNSKKGRNALNKLIDSIEEFKANCKNVEFFNEGDVTKILIKKENLSGLELSAKLFDLKIEDERSNEKSVMLLCGIGTDDKKLARLEKVLKKI